MTFFKQFKEFAVKGNVLDLAVGVIMVPPLAKSFPPLSAM